MAGVVVAGVLAAYGLLHFHGESKPDLDVASKADAAVTDANSTGVNGNNLELSESQLAAVKVEPVALRDFPVEEKGGRRQHRLQRGHGDASLHALSGQDHLSVR